MDPLSFLLVFLGGSALIFAPCTYPLYPILVETILEGETRRETLRKTSFFISSFVLTYSIIGVITTALFGSLLQAFKIIGGFLILIYGITLLDLIPEIKLGATKGPKKNLAGGAIFGVGFSPCLAPIIFTIYTLSAMQNDLLLTFYVLFAFSLGLVVSAATIGLLFKEVIREKVYRKIVYKVRQGMGILISGYGLYLILDYLFPSIFPL